MGFFFAEEKKKKIDKNSKIAKEYSCKVCPRNSLNIHSPKMKPTGSNKPLIYFLGESPGKNEDYLNRQFIGDSGDILRTQLEEIFEDTDYEKFIRFNNVVRCFNNNIKPSQFEIDCCFNSLIEDIEKTKPLAVFSFGDTPLKTIVNGNKITMWRGRRIPVKLGNHTFWFMPMFHPAYILRNREKNNMSEYEKCFNMDLLNNCNFIFNDYYEPKVIDSGYTDNIFFVKDKMELFNCFNLLRDKPYIAIDIETTDLRPFNGGKIISISLGTEEQIFAFEYKDIYKDLFYKFLLESGEKIVHNLKFELEWFLHLFNNDQRIVRETKWHDTMAQAYLIDERTSRDEGMLSLDRLTHLYFGFNLKEKSNVDRKHLSVFKINNVLIYNGMDSKYTYKLFFEQQKMLDNQLKICYNNLIKTTITLSLTQARDIIIDKKEIKSLKEKYQEKLTDIMKEMKGLKEVQEFGEGFNPLSPDHLVKIFRDILKLPKLKETGKKKEYAVDNIVLTRFVNEYNCRLAQLIMDYRSFNKLKSTYVEAVENSSIDDVLKSQWNIYFTGTGRLSSGKSQES